MGRNKSRLIDADTVGVDGQRRPLGEQFKKAKPGEGSVDPETLGGSRTSIKQIVNHRAQTMDDVLHELRLVEQALDRDDLVPTERVLLNRRWRVLIKRMNGQDPRFRVVGARMGRLPKEEQAQVDQFKALQEFEGFLLAEERQLMELGV